MRAGEIFCISFSFLFLPLGAYCILLVCFRLVFGRPPLYIYIYIYKDILYKSSHIFPLISFFPFIPKYSYKKSLFS